jgi:hypothetical protein
VKVGCLNVKANSAKEYTTPTRSFSKINYNDDATLHALLNATG